MTLAGGADGKDGSRSFWVPCDPQPARGAMQQRGKSAPAEACPETSKPRRGGDELLRETFPKPMQREYEAQDRQGRGGSRASRLLVQTRERRRVGLSAVAAGKRRVADNRMKDGLKRSRKIRWLDLDMCRNRQCCSRRVIRGGGVSSSRSGPKGDSVHLDLHGCMGTPPPTHEDRRGGSTAAEATKRTEVHVWSGVEVWLRRTGVHGRFRLPLRDARRRCV